MQEKNKKV